MRQVLAYRVEFWVNYVVSVFFQVLLAYFLWFSIFDHTGKSEIGGFTFMGMVFYYLMVRFMDMAVGTTSNEHEISSHIYEGTLNRFLIYPLGFFSYMYFARIARTLLRGGQGILAVLIFLMVLGKPTGLSLSFSSVALGVVHIFLAMTLFYSMNFLVQLTAFWADNTWSLVVALRFIARFLGGAYLPLTIFPGNVAQILEWLPFSGIIWIPIRTLLGQMTVEQSLIALFTTSGWILIVMLIVQIVWRRGLKVYSGVGI